MNKSHRLIPKGLPALKWLSFSASGFSKPVSGVIYHPNTPPCCGVPIGGVATGCLDIDTRGVLGFNNLFNLLYPEKAFAGRRGNVYPGPLTRKLPDLQPFLGLKTGDTTWVLASKEMLQGGTVDMCVDPVFIARNESKDIKPVKPVKGVKDIDYWGHYPVVDMEYDLEGDPLRGACPLSVGLRVWSPFIPGDLFASSTPCAFLEVHVRNESDESHQCTLGISFPGAVPAEYEGYLPYQGNDSMRFHESPWPPFPPKPDEYTRRFMQFEGVQGVEVSDGQNIYFVGLISEGNAHFGGELGRDGDAWIAIDGNLPISRKDEPGISVAVNFALEPGEHSIKHFILSWYAKGWKGADENHYRNMYTTRFHGAAEIAKQMAPERNDLLSRVLAWQEVIFTEEQLPSWLQDTLINNLALIPETTYWAVANPPLGEWCYQGGYFGMLESPRGCPQIECNPCTFYGNLPIVYFFPELARSQLEGYRHYQRGDGAAPFVIGRWGPPDMATPSWSWQISLNGPVYAILVDRLWQTEANVNILNDFYPSVKKNTIFTMKLNSTPEGVISMPVGNVGMEWFEWGEWLGMCAHLGGIRLAMVKIVERMAKAVGDDEFADQCQQWYAEGSQAMEDDMWEGNYYLNFYDEESGRKSNAVMGYQLDGEWIAEFHGVPHVFQPERILMVLETIRRCNMLPVKCGALSFATPEGKPLTADNKIVEYGSHFIFLPEIMMLAMNYMYAGETEFGLEFLHRTMEEMVLVQRHPWDLPNMIEGDTGKRHFGTDYYQNLMLWAVPAAIIRQDLNASIRPGGLIHRILQAGKRGLSCLSG